MWNVLQVAYGLLLIAGLLAVVGLVFYLIWWLVMIAVSFIPIIGKRGRHDRWEQFNGRGREPLRRSDDPPSPVARSD